MTFLTNTEARAAVEEQIADGVPFGMIEDWIESAAPAGARSALWLLAWAETDHDARRAVIDSLLIG